MSGITHNAGRVLTPAASYLDGPVVALVIIELGLVLHCVTVTKHIAICNSTAVAEEVFAAVWRLDESEPVRIPLDEARVFQDKLGFIPGLLTGPTLVPGPPVPPSIFFF